MIRILAILILLGSSSIADELNIYIDADYSHYSESSESIEMGIKTALNFTKDKFKGYKVNVIRLDHKANSRRSMKNLKKVANDPNRLATFSGIHSPPVLANKKFINENKVLFFSPWAAAAPITRSDSNENWIFRLSVDDSKAGFFLIDKIKEKGFKKPFLLLEKTGWGESNFKTINEALKNTNLAAAGIQFFNWDPTEASLKIQVRKIAASDADSIVFVGNANEGQLFANTMDELKLTLPVFSHWGINGGGFFEKVGFDKLSKQNWQFLQTSFSFLSTDITPHQKSILDKASKLFPDKIKNHYIKSPTGFIHAFDITLILAEAWSQIDKDPSSKIMNLKNKLENLDIEINGLIKTYKKPFQVYTPSNPDAHEALGLKELKLAQFNKDGQVILK